MRRLFIACLFIGTGLTATAQTIDWHPASLQLPTRWSKDVNPDSALPEYPRPQMVRKDWENLNGLWDFSVTDSSAKAPENFTGKILVPYPLESALSGVKEALLPNQTLWYRRWLILREKKVDRLYILHFGAVDYQARVFVNGKRIGDHTGGYQEFDLDITDALKKGENQLLVAVLDPTDKGNNPKGKQVLHPAGIMYTATSGIWQTVWLETVPRKFISSLRMTPNVDGGYLAIDVNINDDSKDISIEAKASDGSTTKGESTTALQLKIPNPHLWSPADPFLYGLTIKLFYKGKMLDEVSSYFAMRKIEIKKDSLGQERIFLNGRFTFNLGVLDQGFWPDGLYTAPTDAALKWDIEAIKSMGFNTIRKHIKIEPARWYYWTDRLGMLVWQDMPYPANLSAEAKAEFERENAANIDQLYNHPSIVCWVLFNEGWNKYDQERLTSWMKAKDPSRLIDGHTGENYDRTSPQDITQKWINSDVTDVHSYPGPGIAPYLAGKARVLGEWGGVRAPTPGHQWDGSKSWGYIETTATEFTRKYTFMIRHLKLFEEEGLSASIYTQPFDVEIEENGLITYDREVFKIPVETIKEINSMIFK
jgi:beta-galactosidase/beta-glucuronidase